MAKFIKEKDLGKEKFWSKRQKVLRGGRMLPQSTQNPSNKRKDRLYENSRWRVLGPIPWNVEYFNDEEHKKKRVEKLVTDYLLVKFWHPQGGDCGK